MSKEYAVYKGDTLLAMGTAKECAAELKVQVKTIHFYRTPTYQNRSKTGNSRITIELDN